MISYVAMKDECQVSMKESSKIRQLSYIPVNKFVKDHNICIIALPNSNGI